MQEKEIKSIYSGKFSDFHSETLYNLGEYLAKRSDFSEEQPLIVTACEDRLNLMPLEDLICCGVAGGGSHAVRLSRLNIKAFYFALSFLGADYGIYLKGDKENYYCLCMNGRGSEIENFNNDFKDFKSDYVFKSGKISGYTSILEKYLRSQQ
jgi:hypothetical protein